ncbi:hypothetical protein YC2023_089487 [Brassica napus]
MAHRRLSSTEIARKIKHDFGGGMMDYARLMVIRTIISREGIGEKIPHRIYERDLTQETYQDRKDGSSVAWRLGTPVFLSYQLLEWVLVFEANQYYNDNIRYGCSSKLGIPLQSILQRQQSYGHCDEDWHTGPILYATTGAKGVAKYHFLRPQQLVLGI